MSSSTSSSDPWRRFFLLAAGSAAVVVAVVYAFVVLIDPFDALPLSLPLDRAPVASNARYAFPALARSSAFDSALFGTSTSRLLRPATLDPLLGSKMVNLSMNDSTVYEQSRLMRVFLRAHPRPRLFALGLDIRWCVTGTDYQKLTPRPFPEWLYDSNGWRRYGEMLNLYSIQSAGQLFGIVAGFKTETLGRDGYTRFVPPDEAYDRAKVAAKLREAGPMVPPGPREGPPSAWRYPALDTLREVVADIPAATEKLFFFVPYNHVALVPAGDAGATVWDECKRRVGELARTTPNSVAVDFLRPSPITSVDDNYWDHLHFTVAVADQLAADLAAAMQGIPGPDHAILGRPQ